MKKILSALTFLAMLLLSGPAGPVRADPNDFTITTFETGKQPTRFIYVAVNGDDDTGQGTSDKPYASLARAAQDVAPGEAIRLHPGTYAGGSYLEGLEGTAAAPIWIGGIEGETRPVIEGGGEGIHLVRARYVIVHDLVVQNTNDNGINSDDGGEYANAEAAQHQIFRNLYIHDVGGGGNQDCLKLSGVNDYYVLDSEFSTCGGEGSGSGIDHVGCHQGILAGNFLHNLSASGNAIQVKGGSEDILIYANDMWNCGERAINIGGSTSFAFFRPPLSTTQPNFEARNIRVIANVFEGSVTPLAFVGAVDSLAANNTLVNPTNWLMRILQETTTSAGYVFLESGNNTVVNNLFYFTRADLSLEDINIGPNTAPGTFSFSHNLWYAHDNPAQSEPDLPVVETAGIVEQDPLLVNTATGNFHLQSGSPAAGSGIRVVGVIYDYEGIRYNDPPSIGAFEGNPPVDLNQLYLPVVQR